MAAQLKVIGSEMASAGMDRQKALEAALAQIDRAFGKGSAMKLGSREKMEVETVSTGSLGLDIALGIGGLPRGRLIEIYWPASSGKTQAALHRLGRPRKLGQDDGRAARDRVGPEDRRHLRLHRRRTRARPQLRQEAGRQYRRAA